MYRKMKVFVFFVLCSCLAYTANAKSKPDELLGRDGHDYGRFKHLLGRDDHDQKPHKKILLGGGDHDKLPHGKKFLLGSDDHDKKPHGKKFLLGADGHDKKPHGKKALLGADGHDLKPHGKVNKKALLGADGHDLKPHGKINEKALLGADGHDLKPHGKVNKKALLGADGHDLKPHGKVNKKKLLGSDNHDKRYHGKLLGSDGHDMKVHKKNLLGSDDHDRRSHAKVVVDGGDHDKKAHGKKKLLGSGDHDKKPHGKMLLGSDGHDKMYYAKLLGRDGHDKKYRGKPRLIGGAHDYFYKKKKNNAMKIEKFNHQEAFNSFMQVHNRTYSTMKEQKKRFAIFRDNMRKIKFYQKNERGTATYGVTKFADLTQKEFRKMLGFAPHMKPKQSVMQRAEIPKDNIPTEFDWRTKGVVTPVKNQGMCGSCWAFSTTGNVEGQWAIKHNHLYSLSEQELVDCDHSDSGCNGGLPENAYKAIEELGGLETEAAYPYEAHDDQCQIDKSKMKVTVNGSVELPQDEHDLAAWLYKNGPISIGINANPLQFYHGGVSHPLKFLCNPSDLDHGMLIVGYGVHTTKYLHRVQPYWLIKNSWGTDWGEQGYYRIYRGDGSCGVNMMATSATVP